MLYLPFRCRHCRRRADVWFISGRVVRDFIDDSVAIDGFRRISKEISRACSRFQFIPPILASSPPVRLHQSSFCAIEHGKYLLRVFSLSLSLSLPLTLSLFLLVQWEFSSRGTLGTSMSRRMSQKVPNATLISGERTARFERKLVNFSSLLVVVQPSSSLLENRSDRVNLRRKIYLEEILIIVEQLICDRISIALLRGSYSSFGLFNFSLLSSPFSFFFINV